MEGEEDEEEEDKDDDEVEDKEAEVERAEDDTEIDGETDAGDGDSEVAKEAASVELAAGLSRLVQEAADGFLLTFGLDMGAYT